MKVKTLLTAAAVSVATTASVVSAQSTPQVISIGACANTTDGKTCQAFKAGQFVNPSTTVTRINYEAALTLNPELVDFIDDQGRLYGFDGYLVFQVG